MAPPEFTTIFSSSDPWEVQLLQGALASEGIKSFVDNEHLVSMNWLYANALGGVRLRVRTRDVEEAAGIIQGLRKEEVQTLPTCSRCGSKNAKPTRWSLVQILGAFALFCIPLFLKRRWQCPDCGHSWRE